MPGVLALRRPRFAGNFPKSVCTSVNECICHGIPDARKLADGDIINIDVTVYLNVRFCWCPCSISRCAASFTDPVRARQHLKRYCRAGV